MRETVTFLPDQPFIEQNQEPITELFSALSDDFPDQEITVNGLRYQTREALRIDDDSELAEPARRWLWEKAQGAQHGYDRRIGGKVYIPSGDPRYMGYLAAINYGVYNFVSGAQPTSTDQKNILVPGGFPHLNAGRLRAALQDDYNGLWKTHSVAAGTTTLTKLPATQ